MKTEVRPLETIPPAATSPRCAVVYPDLWPDVVARHRATVCTPSSRLKDLKFRACIRGIKGKIASHECGAAKVASGLRGCAD